MMAVLSPSASPSGSPHPSQSPPSNPNLSTLPPLITSHTIKRSTLQRPPSYAKNRISSYSNVSNSSQLRSRPQSHVFPVFHSSLSYALVRDFAYPIIHPYHYGPPPEVASGLSTPASEAHRRLSEPSNNTRETNQSQWSSGPWLGDGYFTGQQLPPMAFGDGPPYSEDEDLHSPVVSSRQKKSKSTLGISLDKARGRSPGQSNADVASSITGQETYDGDRGYFAGVNGDGSETYYVGEADESADGPGGELVTYPPDQARHSILSPNTYHSPRQRDSHFAATLPDRSYRQPSTRFDDDDIPSEPNSGSLASNRDSRYSKDYQFTIASPDEEMHGKAVALFDFARENENELPLVEGQVIWVSYRHGQGWLVAEDPKTRESGLVPEEYVRLLRDIEGDWHSLSGEAHDERNVLSPAEPDTSSITTPTQDDQAFGNIASISDGNVGDGKDKRPPIVSTFSTSSKDLNPYPHHLLPAQTRQTPPQVVHYGSQTNTPTVLSPAGSAEVRPTSSMSKEESIDDGKSAKHEEQGS